MATRLAARHYTLNVKGVALTPKPKARGKCKVKAVPNPVEAKRFQTVVRWRCSTAACVIFFNYPEGSPFSGNFFAAGAGSWATAGVPIQPVETYRYTIFLFPIGGGPVLKCDPQVVVWDEKVGQAGDESPRGGSRGKTVTR